MSKNDTAITKKRPWDANSHGLVLSGPFRSEIPLGSKVGQNAINPKSIGGKGWEGEPSGFPF